MVPTREASWRPFSERPSKFLAHHLLSIQSLGSELRGILGQTWSVQPWSIVAVDISGSDNGDSLLTGRLLQMKHEL